VTEVNKSSIVLISGEKTHGFVTLILGINGTTTTAFSIFNIASISISQYKE